MFFSNPNTNFVNANPSNNRDLTQYIMVKSLLSRRVNILKKYDFAPCRKIFGIGNDS
jgi:hypothetical protein